MTTRAILRLLEEAANEVEAGLPVPFDLHAQLSAEGYLLCALDTDIQYILRRRTEAALNGDQALAA